MAYVDTQYILKQMPQYQQSEQRLNDEVKKWQDEIVRQQSALEKLKIAFENEKVLLTDNQQKTKLSVIDSTEKVLNDFIEKKFGTNGESIGLRVNLVKPLQDQIWNAVNAVATKDKYNIIFDKSSDLIMIFTDSRYDITDRVLNQLGLGKEKEEKDTKAVKAKTPAPKRNSTSAKTNAKRETEIEAETETKTLKKADKKLTTKEKSKTTDKPKSGYGSRYVPKKQEVKTETSETNEISTPEKEPEN
jgi:outer membrane protein